MRVALMVLMAAPMLMGASQSVRLQPAGKWVLDYAAESCRLSREFGTGDDKIQILFESNAPERLNLVAMGSRLATDREKVPAKFLPVQGEPINGDVVFTADAKQAAVFWHDVPLLSDRTIAVLKKRDDQERAHKDQRPAPINLVERDAERAERAAFTAAATELQIEPRWNRPVILETGSMGAPIKAFDQCLRQSLRDWGVDPDIEDKIVRPVWAPDPRRWFTAADYPALMEKQNKESSVSVRLTIDPTGRVAKCSTNTHFDAPEFNAVVCDIFRKRSVFAPAELADGTKVQSYYANDVTFRLAN